MMRRIFLPCVMVLALAGCAGPGLFGGGETRPPFRDAALTMAGAKDAVVAGASKADVAALLGPAAVVTFDSGFEVWVYRAEPNDTEERRAEFVVLFTPAGAVSKTRIKPPYARSSS